MRSVVPPKANRHGSSRRPQPQCKSSRYLDHSGHCWRGPELSRVGPSRGLLRDAALRLLGVMDSAEERLDCDKAGDMGKDLSLRHAPTLASFAFPAKRQSVVKPTAGDLKVQTSRGRRCYEWQDSPHRVWTEEAWLRLLGTNSTSKPCPRVRLPSRRTRTRRDSRQSVKAIPAGRSMESSEDVSVPSVVPT